MKLIALRNIIAYRADDAEIHGGDYGESPSLIKSLIKMTEENMTTLLGFVFQINEFETVLEGLVVAGLAIIKYSSFYYPNRLMLRLCFLIC